MPNAMATDETGGGEGLCVHCGEPAYLLDDAVDALVFGAGQQKWVHEGTQEVACAPQG